MNTSLKLFEEGRYEDMIETLVKNIDEVEEHSKQFTTKWIEQQDKNELNMLLTCSKIDKIKDKTIKLFAAIKCGLDKYFEKKSSLSLYSKKEFATPLSDIEYKIIVGKKEKESDTLIQSFFLYVILYYVQSFVRINIFSNDRKTKNLLMRHKSYVSIDYEFRRKVIALMQINFENPVDTVNKSVAYIWIINPGTFTEKQRMIFVNKILTNNNVYNIMHGPDSLDIPYMYEHMFKKNNEITMKFFERMFDTRYACEYYKLNKGLDKSCSYYVAMLFFKTISQEKYDELEKNRELMGPVQDINWDVNNLSSFHLKYALYDVLLLTQHIRDFGKIVSETDQKNMYGYIYYNYLIRFIYMEQNKITDIIPYSKGIVDPMNNFFFMKNGVKYSLVKIFTTILESLVIDFGENKLDYKFISHVRFISNNLNYLIKLIVYHLAHEHLDIFEKKGLRSKKNIDINIFFERLESYGLKHIAALMKAIYKTITPKIKKYS